LTSVTRAILVSLVLLLALAPAAEAAKRRVPQGFFGAMYDRGVTTAPEGDQDEQNALMARAGVESVRSVFSWAQMQPDPGLPPNFDDTDALVARLTRHGMRVLPVVIGTPLWARLYPDEPASPPRLDSDYAAFLQALVGRYGPNGSFWAEHPELRQRPLREWQIWNEPHLQGYWYDPNETWGQDYTALLRAAHDALKQADPGSKVVTAGMADYVWSHLRVIYAQGARGLFDVVAVNFFSSRVGNYQKALKKIRAIMRANHDSRMPIWLTEISWPAAKGRQRPGAKWHKLWLQTDKGMAKKLTQSYAFLVRHRRSNRLGRAYWYTWSSEYKKGDLFNFGGLNRFNGAIFARKPALKAYQRSAKRYEGCTKLSNARCR
jgi:polysaccharide biosynthesis protein PslG